MIHFGSSSSEKESNIQISPMIDMVFLLLVFFIVCTMYMTQQYGVPVELPKAQGVLQQEAPLEVTLTRDGGLYFQGQPVTVEQLKAEAQTAVQQGKGQVVNLRADQEVSYGRVMGVMEELKTCGIKDFALAVQLEGSHG